MPHSNRIIIGKFLKIILAIQLTAVGLIGFEYLGVKIPILREVFCFIYLAFIPGILILGILRLDRLSVTETVLYSAGLSCSFLMFVGLFMNILYPVFGVTKPLSTTSLLLSLTFLISVLCLICLIRNASYMPSFFTNLNITISVSPYTLSFLLIPFLAIFGAYLVCVYDNNILLLIFILIVALIPILIGFNKIPDSTYPLLTFVVAISLLLHNDLSSMYLQGSDVYAEYHVANLVRLNSYWDASIFLPANSLLCDTIFAPIISDICGLSLTWVYKIVYPFLFSLVPLGLYHIYKVQTNKKVAFLSCFFFTSITIFYTEMLQLPKQMMAELFLILLMLLMVNKQMNNTKRVLLSIIFAFSLIVSHYGTSYIFLISLIFVYLSVLLSSRLNKIIEANIATYNFVMLFSVSSLAWYIYTAGSTILNSVVRIGDHTISNISELFAPVKQGGAYWIVRELSPCEDLLRLLYFVSVFLTFVGFLDIVYQSLNKKRKNNYNIQNEYFLFSASFIGWLIISTVLPTIMSSGSLGFSRMYHISTIFLAPFCIIGGIKIEKSLTKFFCRDIVSKHTLNVSNTYKGISIFLMLFFLFNSSFVSETIQETIGGDHAISPSISQPRIEKEGSTEEKIAYYTFSSSEEDVYGAKWIGKHMTKQKISVDSRHSAKILGFYGTPNMGISKIKPTMGIMRPYCKDYYVFMRKLNYVDNIMQSDLMIQKNGYKENWWNTSEILPTLEKGRNKIYSNGGSVIYK